MTQALSSPNHTTHAGTDRKVGLFAGLGAYLWWGFIALYLKQVATVPAFEVLSHRIIWSLLLVTILTSLRGCWPEVHAAMRNWRTLGILAASTSVLAVNWLIFILAVTNGHVVEASLGYFITPLVNVLIGMAILGEGLRKFQAVGVIIAAIGVTYLTVSLGHAPWIAFGLALTFGSYGLFRKIAPVSSITGLTIETAILFIPALIVIAAYRPTHPLNMWLMLSLSGVVTAVPLLLFAAAARRLRMVTMGFLQYLAPTCQFGLAVFAFGEKLTRAHVVSFTLIWIALLSYSWDAYGAYRAGQLVPQPIEEPS